MNVLSLLQARFREPITSLGGNPDELLPLIKPAQDAKFGDYQANFAMPLGKQLGKPPRDVAQEIVARARLDDLCQPPEVAGPGFINLRLRDDWLTDRLIEALRDERLGISRANPPRVVVIDYSSPNVAKPMHVGHIRSTVIGDAIDRTLRFLGHRVISDNHLGDWGTQFGMIIYGYKHFVDRAAFAERPVAELGRLYKLVHQLVSYFESRDSLPKLEQQLAKRRETLEQQRVALASAVSGGDKGTEKKLSKETKRLESQLKEQQDEIDATRKKIAAVDGDDRLSKLAAEHATIGDAVLAETAKLHAGDAENRSLWEQFLPRCREEIERIYDRLNIHFDVTYGESFYHDQLGAIVRDFQQRGVATVSEGAVCVFLDGFTTPMIIQKSDGAFLYATTDLATIEFRLREWQPDSVLYVVDHRQSEHFEKLFAVAKRWQSRPVDWRHVSFGTVLGEDRRPYKTRSGDTIGLEGLLDEAIRKAAAIVAENDDKKPNGPELGLAERQQIAEVVGIGALKYADLSQHRTSDYVFSYEKMLAMDGNTAPYLQYAYARVCGIFRKGEVDAASLRRSLGGLTMTHPAERALGLVLLAFEEVLQSSTADYTPNMLTEYLYSLSKHFSVFFENCSVLKAESETSRQTRLALCDLTGRTIKQGLELLGIRVVEKM